MSRGQRKAGKDATAEIRIRRFNDGECSNFLFMFRLFIRASVAWIFCLWLRDSDRGLGICQRSTNLHNLHGNIAHHSSKIQSTVMRTDFAS